MKFLLFFLIINYQYAFSGQGKEGEDSLQCDEIKRVLHLIPGGLISLIYLKEIDNQAFEGRIIKLINSYNSNNNSDDYQIIKEIPEDCKLDVNTGEQFNNDKPNHKYLDRESQYEY